MHGWTACCLPSHSGVTCATSTVFSQLCSSWSALQRSFMCSCLVSLRIRPACNSLCLVVCCAVKQHRRLWLAANLNPDECGTLIAFQEQELDAERRGVQQQRSLTVVAMKEMQHMTKVAESFNAANLGSSVAFWSEVSQQRCLCTCRTLA